MSALSSAISSAGKFQTFISAAEHRPETNVSSSWQERYATNLRCFAMTRMPYLGRSVTEANVSTG